MDIETTLDEGLWKTIAGVSNLKSLKIMVDHPKRLECEYERIGGDSLVLPLLEELAIDQGPIENDETSWYMGEEAEEEEEVFEGLVEFLELLDGSKLRTLSIHAEPRVINMISYGRMESLEEMTIKRYGEDQCLDVIPAIFALSKLRVLSVEGLEDYDFLPLIEGLPNLAALDTGRDKFRMTTIKKARDYLMGEGRKLLLNGRTL